MVLAHQAGLPKLEQTISAKGLLDYTHITTMLAAQTPLWEPGTGVGYHPLTFGYLVGELIRRVTGLSAGEFIEQEIAKRFAVDIRCGLPPEQQHRAADIVVRTDEELQTRQYYQPSKLRAEAFRPNVLSSVNTVDFRRASLPILNMQTSASGLARLYGLLVAEDGGSLGCPEMRSALREAKTQQMYDFDVVLELPVQYGIGYQVNSEVLPPIAADAFGHSGYGGSFAFADASAKLGFSFVRNWFSLETYDLSQIALVQEVYCCLDKLQQRKKKDAAKLGSLSALPDPAASGPQPRTHDWKSTPGRRPANHVEYPKFAEPLRWYDNFKFSQGERAWKSVGMVLKLFDAAKTLGSDNR